MDVRVGRPIQASMLVNGIDALRIPKDSSEEPVGRISHPPLDSGGPQPGEALGGLVVDGQLQPEEHRSSKAFRVLGEGQLDRALIPSKRPVSLADPVKHACPPLAKLLLAVGDVRDAPNVFPEVAVVVDLNEV